MGLKMDYLHKLRRSSSCELRGLNPRGSNFFFQVTNQREVGELGGNAGTVVERQSPALKQSFDGLIPGADHVPPNFAASLLGAENHWRRSPYVPAQPRDVTACWTNQSAVSSLSSVSAVFFPHFFFFHNCFFFTYTRMCSIFLAWICWLQGIQIYV